MPWRAPGAAGLPTEVDLSKIEPGQMATLFWRKQQIFVVKRTPEMLVPRRTTQLKDPVRVSDHAMRQKLARAQARSAGAHLNLHASDAFVKTLHAE
jgi:ubiquinol-cytochrome c reductase iron-sulfur subunit